MLDMPLSPLPSPACAPCRLSGVVYAALLNHPAEISALGEAVHQAPYKAPPRAPVLGVKPRNTLVGVGARIAVPAAPGQVQIGATLGIVIGRTACRLSLTDALQHVAGWLVAADLSLAPATPGRQTHYRPAVRARARDGFCPLGQHVRPAAAITNPDDLVVQVWADGALQHQGSTAGRVRGVAQLLVDVTEFMTLSPGDVLLLGGEHGMPVASIGQTVQIDIAGVDRLVFTLVAEPAEPAVKPETA